MVKNNERNIFRIKIKSIINDLRTVYTYLYHVWHFRHISKYLSGLLVKLHSLNQKF